MPMSRKSPLLEANLAAFIWFVMVFAFAKNTSPSFLESAISFGNTIGAVILTVRIVPLARWQELLLVILHVVLMVFSLGLTTLFFSVARTNFQNYLPIIVIGTSVLLLSGRLLRRFWHGWNQLRRNYLVWALTHAHLMLFEGMVLGVMILLILLQIILFSPPAENDPLTLIEYIVSLDPYITIGGGLTLFILAVILPPSALFSYLVSRRMVRRILVLEEATRRVEHGDYTTQVKVEGQDEIARLQARYNAMTTTLDETIQKLKLEQATVTRLAQLQRDTVANVSHDLRTPLTTLQIYLDNLPASPRTDLIKKEIDHLRRLTDDLFDAAQNETLALTLRLKPVAIKPLLDTIVEVTAITAKQHRQVEVLLDVPSGLPALLLDEDRFSQIIRNLLQNALRWTPPGGMILVKADSQPAHVSVSIEDTGVGIASNELSNIWRRHYQINPESEGSGLGLTTVKNLVEAMNGTISVTSVLHRGTCFRIEFPIMQ